MLKVGDMVRIMIPLSEQTASTTLKQWNGFVTKVKGDHMVAKTNSTRFHVYTLEDVTSDAGVDFVFTEDWLRLLESEDEESEDEESEDEESEDDEE